jgi:hypothetical protein
VALGFAVEEVVNADLDELDGSELEALVVALHRQQARLAAVSAQAVAAADARRVWVGEGYKSTAAWLGDKCRLPPEGARAEVRLGRRLRAMPATTEALERGDIGLAHAHRLASLAAPRTAEAFRDGEKDLVDCAASMRWVEFVRLTTYWRQLADHDGTEDRAAKDESLRRLYLSEGLDGMGILDAVLTPLGRATVGEALRRIDDELFQSDWGEARERLGDAVSAADLARTPAQRRCDALVEMANRATTAPRDGKRPKPLVSVLVGYETFAGRICELADGTVLAPGAVAGLLDGAVIERIVYDGPSRVIDVGQGRLFTGALRRAIEARDRFCYGPGCDVPAHLCEMDHVKPHGEGGATEQTNGDPGCGFHHRERHRYDADPSPPRRTRPRPPGPPATAAEIQAELRRRLRWLTD